MRVGKYCTDGTQLPYIRWGTAGIGLELEGPTLKPQPHDLSLLARQLNLTTGGLHLILVAQLVPARPIVQKFPPSCNNPQFFTPQQLSSPKTSLLHFFCLSIV